MTALNGSWNALIEDIRERLAETEKEMAELRQLVADKQSDLTRYKGMLRAAGELEPQQAKPKPKPKPAPRVNAKTREAILYAIATHTGEAMPGVPGSFTVTTLEGAGVHSSSVRTAVAMLREEGVIRALGKVPNSPRMAPEAYVMADRHVG